MKRTAKRILLYGFSLPAGLVMGVAIFLAIQYPHRESWMFWAAKNNHPRLAWALLKAGVPSCMVDDTDSTPLHWALEKRNQEVAEVLASDSLGCQLYDNFYSLGIKDDPLLGLARRNRYFEIWLSVYERKHKRISPLIYSIRSGDKELVLWLLQRGADVNEYDHEPIFSAAYYGNLEVLKLLHEWGRIITM